MDFLILIVVLPSLALYFLPTIVALSRGAKRGLGIFVLNLFLGWTFIAWVLALVWAVSAEKASGNP